MKDTDLYPCPHCRGEMISTCWDDELLKDAYYVFCESCAMRSPIMETGDGARHVYNVVAKLVDDVMNAYGHVDFDRNTIVGNLGQAALTFFQARREHPPY